MGRNRKYSNIIKPVQIAPLVWCFFSIIVFFVAVLITLPCIYTEPLISNWIVYTCALLNRLFGHRTRLCKADGNRPVGHQESLTHYAEAACSNGLWHCVWETQ